MIGYRPFLNSDPPALAEIWNAQPPSRGLLQPMHAAALDQLVLSKPFFDRRGLVVATDEERPIGFVHAGFAPNAQYSGLDYACGIVAALMVAPSHPQQAEVGRELLARGEQYLRAGGAGQVFAGCWKGWNPFYLGVYGGSQGPGVLRTDQAGMAVFQACGYEVDHRRTIRQRELVGFRPPIDRQLVELRRKAQFTMMGEERPATWWHACIFAHVERIECSIALRGGEPAAATAHLWDVEPLASSWGAHAIGLSELAVDQTIEEPERSILATHLLGESFRQLQSQGITLAEIQFRADDRLLSQVSTRLGFSAAGEGVCFRRRLD